MSRATYFPHRAGFALFYPYEALDLFDFATSSKIGGAPLGTTFTWEALQKYRHSAKHPETFEQDICSIYFAKEMALLPLVLQPKWRVNDKGYCITDNVEERTKLIDERNARLKLFAPVVGGGLLLGLIALNVFIYRMLK